MVEGSRIPDLCFIHLSTSIGGSRIWSVHQEVGERHGFLAQIAYGKQHGEYSASSWWTKYGVKQVGIQSQRETDLGGLSWSTLQSASGCTGLLTNGGSRLLRDLVSCHDVHFGAGAAVSRGCP